MNRPVFASAALLIVAAAISCGHPEDSDYFPILADSKQAEYAVNYIAPLLGAQKARLVVRGGGQETINGQTYYKEVAVFSGIPGATPSTTYSRRTPKGILTVDGEHKNVPEQLDPPLPLSVGTAWQTRGAHGMGD